MREQGSAGVDTVDAIQMAIHNSQLKCAQKQTEALIKSSMVVSSDITTATIKTHQPCPSVVSHAEEYRHSSVKVLVELRSLEAVHVEERGPAKLTVWV